MSEQPPKLHIDTGWKAEAQAEKERLAREDEKKAKGREPRGPRDLPNADFPTLVSVLASQALMGLGTVPDRSRRGVLIDLEGARFAIDLLGVLEEKTRGNLSDEETKELTQILTELRDRWLQVSRMVAQQMAAAAKAEGTAGAAGTAGGEQPG